MPVLRLEKVAPPFDVFCIPPSSPTRSVVPENASAWMSACTNFDCVGSRSHRDSLVNELPPLTDFHTSSPPAYTVFGLAGSTRITFAYQPWLPRIDSNSDEQLPVTGFDFSFHVAPSSSDWKTPT